MTDDDIKRGFTAEGQPSTAEIARIAVSLSADLKPVRPLPSNALLWLIALGLFAAVTFLLAAAVGFKAVAVLSGGQLIAYYGVIALLAGLLARALVEQMIPGTARLLSSVPLSVLALPVLIVLVLTLFAERDTSDHFVSHGVPCLRLGLISAFLSGVLGWRLLRRGYSVTPVETMTVFGMFAGLTGVGVLALHCSILNAAHVLVWHLGAMLLAGLAGLLLGRYAD